MDLQCTGLTFSFENESLFDDISFTARQGEHTIIEGDSGSGKSTFIKLLLGFYRPDKGQISINGENYNPQNIRKYTAWLPQDLDLGSGPVMEVLQKPFEFRINQDISISKNRIVNTLEKLGLPNSILDKQFRELSTGQRQRVGIAICHLLGKPIILLDEPTSALDQESKERAAKILLGHTNKTVISASHDPWWVKRADNVIKLR